MIHTDTALRMSIAAWMLDTKATMPPAQWHWLTTRLKAHTPFTPVERARLKAPLLAWAVTMGDAYAAVVAREFGEGIPPAPGMSGLEIYARHPGQEAREQAAALNEEARPVGSAPLATKGDLL